jgi:hypothetical protein
VSVTRQDAASVSFRIKVPDPKLVPSRALDGTERLEIDGYYRLGEPGAPPTLSRVFLVGLPPSGSYTLNYRLVASTPLGSHRLEPVAKPVGIHDDELGPGISEKVVWDDDVFRSYRDPATVSADSVVYVRHQRVLPVRVNPVSYDPQSQSLSIAKEIEIEVRFANSGVKDGAPRDERAGWNDIFGRMLVNATQASRWPVLRPATVESTTRGASRVVPGAIKVRVYQTAMHRVRASRAIAAGFPAGQPVSGLRLFRRLYSDATLSASESDIAFDVNEDAAGTPGVFDGADEIIFYGRRLRDDPNSGDRIENYAAYNVYWLEPSAGTRMVQRAPAPGFVTADTSTAAFPVNAQHFETDIAFRDGTPPGISDVYYYKLRLRSRTRGHALHAGLHPTRNHRIVVCGAPRPDLRQPAQLFVCRCSIRRANRC